MLLPFFLLIRYLKNSYIEPKKHTPQAKLFSAMIHDVLSRIIPFIAKNPFNIAKSNSKMNNINILIS